MAESLNKYLQLPLDWSDKKWLRRLPVESRLAWVQLLCHAKAFGMKGKFHVPDLEVFAEKNLVSLESLVCAIDAAKEADELFEEDGCYVILDFMTGDETGAERQRRYRAKKALEAQKAKDSVTERNGETECNDRNALRNDGNACNTEERRGEDNKTSSDEEAEEVPAVDPEMDLTEPAQDGEDPPPEEILPFQEVEFVMTAVATALEWSPPHRTEILRYVKPESPIRLLVKEVGLEQAAQIFTFAYQNWGGKVSWEAAYHRRNQIMDQMSGKVATGKPDLINQVQGAMALIGGGQS